MKEVLEYTRIVEVVIDCLWVLNMGMCFTTAFTKGGEVETQYELKAIAKNYLSSPNFYIDVVTTFPTLFTFYLWPDMYYFKLLRLYFLSRSKKIIKNQIQSLETCQCITMSKQTISKIEDFTSICLLVFIMMHSVSCVWLLIGERYENSWIHHPIYGLNSQFGTIEQEDGTMVANWETKYITSFYWSVTTLATVGYGDVKGFTAEEYIFNMFVEFIGIAFFSFVMGSINNNFLTDSSSKEYVMAKIEQVDIWLVKLDNSRTSKSLPTILYQKIRVYIRESLIYDHKKLISGNNFLYQLKPKLRKQLVHELFTQFIDVDFPYLFSYDFNGQRLQCGNEFICFFVSSLYCRVFVVN